MGDTAQYRRRTDGAVLLSLVLLVGAIALGEATPVDFMVQDAFFDAATGTWTVDATTHWSRLVFYDGPKAAIIVLGVVLVVFGAGPRRWRARFGLSRGRLAAAILVMAAVPAGIGVLKAHSDVYCPAQLIRYGGTHEYRRPFTPRSDAGSQPRRGHCWPAGHASGGFGLLGVCLLARSRQAFVFAMMTGLAAGWTMGAYQILKGAHFLSHTIVTMLFAAIITGLVVRWFPPAPERPTDAPGHTV